MKLAMILKKKYGSFSYQGRHADHLKRPGQKN